jgi:hypothetical protein
MSEAREFSKVSPSFEVMANMKAHEVIVVEDANLFTTALRVPHGWMYRSYDKSHNILTSVFVPMVDSRGVL